MSTVRYLVHDVDGAVEFYTRWLGFTLAEDPTGNPLKLFQG